MDICRYILQKKQFIRTSFLIACLFFGSLAAIGQQHRRWLPPGADSLYLGAEPVVVDSIRFIAREGHPKTLDYEFYGGANAYLRFKKRLSDSTLVLWYSIPWQPPKRFSLRDPSLILPPEAKGQAPREEQLYASSITRFEAFEGLQSQGSLSRNIRVGNNQDAVLNSSLNLQLNGQLGPQTAIRASISDNTVPVQADGFTQQLREFDRVYLELENPDFGLLRAGDYNFLGQEHFLLRFDKRISGAGLSGKYKLASDKTLQADLQAGLARGRFARNRFQGEEGNQGPYKLRGANGEAFIIIISGSERVYIDGKLLKRGQQFDYVVDYNAGEITFTALQPITRDKRIVVEFQYTEQNYLRSVLSGALAVQGEKWRTGVQYYREGDSPSRPLGGELSPEEQARLAAVGDDLLAARLSTISPQAFDPGQVQYRLTDSLGFDSVLVFSGDSSAALYQASFSFVGQGQGDYRLVESRANGRVFQWVAPVNGVRQGAYAPVRQLNAPNRLQVLSVRQQFRDEKGQELDLDLGISENTINLLSDLDRGNDFGWAGRLRYQKQWDVGQGQLGFRGSLEQNDARFNTVERLRSVEFQRDWNLPLEYSEALQLVKTELFYQRDSLESAYEFSFLESTLRSGFGQKFRTNWQGKRAGTEALFRFNRTENDLSRRDFWREDLQAFYRLKEGWSLNLRSVGEWNLERKAADSLTANSYTFFEYQVFSLWGDTAQSFAEVGYLQRWDDSVRQAELSNVTLAETWFGRTRWKHQRDGDLQFSLFHRSLLSPNQSETPTQRTINSRVSYQQRFAKGAISSTSFYESGAGNEPRRSFVYLEVPAGTGTHTHTDYNGNGRRELDEFEIAPTPDLATFVRVFSPNLEFVRTSQTKVGQNLSIRSPGTWRRGKDWQKVLARFQNLLAYQLDRRSLLQGASNDLDPFRAEADSSLVALNESFRQTLFFNRSSLKFGGDYSFRRTDARNLLTFGIEQRQIQEQQLNLRYGLAEQWLLRGQLIYAEKENRSGNFQNRNFGVLVLRNQYELSYQWAEALQVSLDYEWREEESSGDNENRLFAQSLGLKMNYTQKLNLQSELRYIYNDFSGATNNPAAYEMLQAFRPGRNMALQLSLQKTFLENLVVSLLYNGRFSGDQNAIHVGSLQVKAFL